jgi:hypothetical protein
VNDIDMRLLVFRMIQKHFPCVKWTTLSNRPTSLKPFVVALVFVSNLSTKSLEYCLM